MQLQSIQPKVGAAVFHRGERCHITNILDLTRFIVQPDVDGARRRPASLHELRPVSMPSDDPADIDLSDVDPKMLAEARHRYEIIEPLVLGTPGVSSRQRAKEGRVSRATVFRYLKAFRETGMILSLVPNFVCRGAPLKPRISKQVDEVITKVLHDFHLKPQRPTLVKTAQKVINHCRAAGLKPPSSTTVRNRMRALDRSLVTRARDGRKAAECLRPLRGSLPGADRPWDIIHIDHTPLDIILVDRETRQPIGRPTITVAEDAGTRMIVGFCLSFDSPRWMSVALCLAQAILPKDKWLSQHQVEGEWPVWGVPKVVHVDNAKEFRGSAIQQAAKELGFSIQNRRAAHPQDGGRIERLIRTINQEVHGLPGTTFSNPKQRGEYKSEKEASMTLDEIEKYLTLWIVNSYHLRPHRGLNGKYPLRVWKDLLLGTENLPGIGLPPVTLNEEFVRLRLLPFKDRYVHRYGVDLFGIRYFGDHLRQMVEKADAEINRAKKQFRVRYDPRDLSRVWIRDHFMGTSGEYVELNYLNTSKPPVSLYELEASKGHERKSGNKNPNEDTIFATHEKLEGIAENSVAATKTARKEREKLKRYREAVSTQPARAKLPTPVSPASVTPTESVPLPHPISAARISPSEAAYEDVDN